jgi:hypothetical protein
MIYLLVVLIVAAIVTVAVIRKRNQSAAESRYVCDVCGERDCICHKVDD